VRPVSFIFNATGSFVGDTRIARTAAVPSVQVICGSGALQPDTLNGSEFPPVPKLTLVPYARLTSPPGTDVSGVLDLLQAQSITKASAATTAAGNLMAATDTGFEIRETLDGVINLHVAPEPGQVNSFALQQATTMQLTLVRPHTKDSIVPLSGELLIYFPADRANMRTFRTWKLRFAVGLVTSSLSRLFPLKINCLES
jgi:hypothetical protein